MNSFRLYFLLFILIIVWALNVVFTKIGLGYMPPIWLTAIRLGSGALFAFLILSVVKPIRLPRKKDWPFIISIGFFQIGLFQTLFNCGMLYVHAGRSAILTYATPIWVTPLAILFFGEKLTRLKLIGFLLGISGILLLFSPASFDWSDHKMVIGNGFLMLSSACWAGAMLHTRYGKWHCEPLELLPWQLLIATILPLFLAFTTESFRSISWNWILVGIILFSSILATVLAYWLCITISKQLPVITTSLSLLCVPVLTLLFSAWLIHEPLTAPNVIAMALILAGLSCIVMESKLKK